MPTLPTIHGRHEYESGAYRRETIDLEFSNGERRKYAEGEGAHVDQDAGKLMACVLPDTDKKR